MTFLLSDFVDICVDTPQGTKLGPILWLSFMNHLVFSEGEFIKYSDDTTI